MPTPTSDAGGATRHAPIAPGRPSHTVMDSPVGPLTLVAHDGALTGLYLAQPGHHPPVEALGNADADLFTDAVEQLEEYLAGQRTRFSVPFVLHGTPFQRRVWEALVDIPYGETISYGELARRLGQPTASRAVGLANGRNPLSIIVPCHRVIGANGKLTGYGGGIERKQWLLEHERPR